MGAGTLAMIGGTVVIVGFLTLAAGGTLAVQGYSLAGQHRHRGADRVSGRVHQRAYLGAGGRRDRSGGHLRRRGDRAAGCDADQRGDRRAGIHGHPAGFVSGDHQDRGRNDRDHAAVQHRGHPVVRGQPVHHDVLFGQSGGLYNHYFNTFLNPIDLLWSFLQAVLMALTILLIHTYYGYFASGGPIRRRRRDGQRGAHLADRRGVGDAAGLAVHLRLQRQLQPVRVARGGGSAVTQNVPAAARSPASSRRGMPGAAGRTTCHPCRAGHRRGHLL